MQIRYVCPFIAHHESQSNVELDSMRMHALFRVFFIHGQKTIQSEKLRLQTRSSVLVVCLGNRLVLAAIKYKYVAASSVVINQQEELALRFVLMHALSELRRALPYL